MPSGMLNAVNSVTRIISISVKFGRLLAFLYLQGPDEGRSFANSSMIGIGITMEGINQNEIIYDFMLEKSWRKALSPEELSTW